MLALSLPCLAQAADPLSKSLLLKTISVGGVDEASLVRVVQTRKVDFALTPETEAELRQAGGSDALIQAVRGSGPSRAISPPAPAPTVEARPSPSQGAAAPEAPATAQAAEAIGGAPLTQAQIALALQSGASQERLATMAGSRGLAFELTPEIGRGLQAEGAGSELIAALAIARVSRDEDAAPGDQPGPGPASLPEDYVPLPLAKAKDFDPFASRGRLDLRMYVDGVSEVRIQGDRVIHTNLEARLGRNAGAEYTQPLPSEDLRTLEIEKKDGRGRWVAIQRPAADNEYELILRIYDEKGGEDRYHLRIEWDR